MTTTLPPEIVRPLAELLLSLADDKLMLGHRNADWTGLGPILEEDIAFSALAQDALAHAQVLYEFIAGLTGQSADELAFGRTPAEYRCARLVEVSDEFDWARAIVREWFCAHFNAHRLMRLAESSFSPLAALASRLRAEEQIHVEHADGWVGRLGRGTEESARRMQAAVDALGPLAAGLCQPTAGVNALEAAGIYPGNTAAMNQVYLTELASHLGSCGLKCDGHAFSASAIPATGGRSGQHDADFGQLLDELAEVYRIEPHAQW